MDAYDRCTNLEKNLADSVAIYGQGRELFRPPTYFYSKTNQMHNCSSLLNITLHVSGGLYVHHQDFKIVHTALSVCHTGSLTACQRARHLVPAGMQSTNLYDIRLMLYVQS